MGGCTAHPAIDSPPGDQGRDAGGALRPWGNVRRPNGEPRIKGWDCKPLVGWPVGSSSQPSSSGVSSCVLVDRLLTRLGADGRFEFSRPGALDETRKAGGVLVKFWALPSTTIAAACSDDWPSNGSSGDALKEDERPRVDVGRRGVVLVAQHLGRHPAVRARLRRHLRSRRLG